MTAVLTIITAVFLIGALIKGFRKGFLKILLTTMSLIVTIVVAAALVTPVSKYIQENTQLGLKFEERVEKRLFESGEDENEGTQSGQKTKNSGNIKNEKDKSEEEVIADTKLPAVLKKALISKNTAGEYLKLGVTGFKEYTVKSIANILLKILVYIALVVVIYIAVRVLLMVSKVITKIPVIGGINRILGAALGVFEGLLILWLIGFVISLISNTGLGSSIVDIIHKSSFLTFLYDNNCLLKLIKTVITFF